MNKPLLIIVNGFPGSGKTILAKRLAQDLSPPLFSRDSLYEHLFDSLDCTTNVTPPLLGSTAFSLLYYILASILTAHQSVIIEQYFGRPDLRTAEFLDLQRRADFAPFQIMCKADGAVLIERILARTQSGDRHASHPDLASLEQNRQRFLHGSLSPLALDGQSSKSTPPCPLDSITLTCFVNYKPPCLEYRLSNPSTPLNERPS